MVSWDCRFKHVIGTCRLCHCTAMSGYHEYVRLKMDGLLELWQTLKYELCFDFCVCDVCCTSENPLPVGEGVWSMCNTMKQADTVHGLQQWQDKCWDVVTWAPSMSTTYDVWCTDTFICWCQRARHSLGSAQNCPVPTGLQRSVCTLGAKESHSWWQSSLYGTMSLSCIHCTCYTDEREQFWSWNKVNYTKPEARKRMCDRGIIISFQQRKWKHCHQ